MVINVINWDKLIYIIYHFWKVLSKIYNLKHLVNYVILGQCQLVLYIVLHDLDLLLYQLICFNISKAQWLRYSTCVLQTTSLILHRAFVHIHLIRFCKIIIYLFFGRKLHMFGLFNLYTSLALNWQHYGYSYQIYISVI